MPRSAILAEVVVGNVVEVIFGKGPLVVRLVVVVVVVIVVTVVAIGIDILDRGSTGLIGQRDVPAHDDVGNGASKNLVAGKTSKEVGAMAVDNALVKRARFVVFLVEGGAPEILKGLGGNVEAGQVVDVVVVRIGEEIGNVERLELLAA